MEVTEKPKDDQLDFFQLRNNGSATVKMRTYRNQLKNTLKKLQSPAKNQTSLMYRQMMPEYTTGSKLMKKWKKNEDV